VEAAVEAEPVLGIGWRAELAVPIDRDSTLRFIEITAEHFPGGRLPQALHLLREQGRTIVPHGISVSLGSAEGLNLEGLRKMGRLAKELGSPYVSEHIAFVRAGELEAGHLLPLPRTRVALNVLVENIRRAQEVLTVPLALENISALFAWPDAEFSEAQFLSEVLARTGCLMLLDASNVYANAHNLGLDASAFLDNIPLDRLAYVHVGGGIEGPDGAYHDSHAHPVTAEALKIVEELSARAVPPAVMLERDDHFPSDEELQGELSRIREALGRGAARRNVSRQKSAGRP
jgi:uncharacterized protein (UPF0276 family)